ncbi:MAG TPA: penicillin-binding protein 2 [Micromonosporaceae bacterium]
MNAPLRRVGVVVLVLFGLLFANLNWVQAYKADAYRNDPNNRRVQLLEYQRERGVIALNAGAGGEILAKSVATNDTLKYLRTYPKGAAYASVTGYKPVNMAAIGVERAENDFLSGNSDALFADRLTEMFTGQRKPGGNVILTVSKAAQETAYRDLINNRAGAKAGAAVAIDPKTGAILALVSTPSYDPNPLASHDTDKAFNAYDALNKDPDKPLLNRATQETFPPGSTFKVIVSAAALENGYTPQTMIPAGPVYKLPGTANASIHNDVPSICPEAQVTLIDALTESCNTGYAQLGVKLGADTVKAKAQAFGFEDNGLTYGRPDDKTLSVAASHTGSMQGEDGQPDPAQVAQSSIGQRDVRMTPMEGALIAASVANDGTQMRPYLIQSLQTPDLSTYYNASPKSLRQPVSPQVAHDLQTMMISVVEHGTGRRARIDGFQVGGKTGTAENGADAQEHGWFIGFVMKDNQPLVAVAVMLEHAGEGGSAEASRIAGDIMKAVLHERGMR